MQHIFLSTNKTEHGGLKGITENEKQQMTLQACSAIEGKSKNSSLLH